MKIGIFLPTWVGDAAMATPALRAVRRQFPQAQLIGIGRPYLTDLLAGTRWLDGFIPYYPSSKVKAERSLSVAKTLRRERLEITLLMRNSFREALVAWMSGAKRRVGYDRYGRGALLTDRLKSPTRDGKRVHYRMVDYYLALAYRIGCPPESPRIELGTTAEDEALVDRIWSELRLRPGERVITFNCSGAYGAAKLWPTRHFAELGHRVATQLKSEVLVICGPNERVRAAEIATTANHPRVHSLSRFPLSLGLSKACVKRSDLFVTTDSGPRQFGVAFDVPMVSLFGPSDVIWGENPLARELTLQLPLSCAPCQRPTCPLEHHRCMRDLTVDQVFRAVVEQLRKSEAAKAA